MTQFSDIPVVIFCGGQGSRIKEETIDKPKPMINVGGFPILWHIMKIYKHHGYNKFILTLGYKGDYIRDFLKRAEDNIFNEFDITLAETGLDTATGGRLLRCADLIKTDTFMTTYGDGVSDVDINAVLKHHQSFDDIVGTLTGVYIPHKFGIVSYGDDGRMTSYKKGHLMSEPIHSGFMVFNKQFLDHLTDEMFVEDPFDDLAKKGKFSVYSHKGYFGAVDTYKDLETLNDAWNNNPKWKVWTD